MEQEFQEIIKKNLPAQVGDALKSRLLLADQESEKLKRLEAELKSLLIVVSERDKIVYESKAENERLQGLVKTEAELNKRQHDLDLEVLKYQLLAEKEKSDFAKSVALGLVRNTEYRRTLQDSKHGPDSKDQFGNVSYATRTQNSTETNEAK